MSIVVRQCFDSNSLCARGADDDCYCAGREKGLLEDELVAMELGVSTPDQLTDAQQQYVGKVKDKLIEVTVWLLA